ncbi:WXG100 family type VII secretion target [Asanoa sp. NPDC049573]|uniref:WXG100 family type VII secretion target n=1 Tax=Asanoa sp. NPDC049573 TaxID=3155396 RepID=UPI0034364DA6
MSQPIQVSYAALENAQSQMQAISKGIEGRLDSLRSQLQQMQWNGSDREAYQGYQAQWDAAVADINAILHEIGAAVGTANQNYQSTEANNAKVWG